MASTLTATLTGNGEARAVLPFGAAKNIEVRLRFPRARPQAFETSS